MALWCFSHPLTVFESLAINIQGQKRVLLLAWLYNWLLTRTSIIRGVKAKWGRELNTSFTAPQWKKIHMFNQTFSLNTNFKESRYKMLHNYYLTPERLCKIFPTMPDWCWRCQQMGAMYLHIWWTCPSIVPIFGIWCRGEFQKWQRLSYQPFHPRLFLLLDFEYFHISLINCSINIDCKEQEN